MEVTGRGQLDLTTRNVNYDLVAKLTESIGIAGCETMDPHIGDSIPLTLTGNITAPVIRPDLRELVRSRTREAAAEAVQDRLREAVERLFER